jgi:lysophospholipase L1-like esterase
VRLRGRIVFSHAVKSAPYSVVFFGDSLTEGWDTAVWERYLASRGVLKAGVSGDRTDNLLWRLEQGNLAGPQPKAVVLLIGTNDLAYGRSPLARPMASPPISKYCASISQRRAFCFSDCYRVKRYPARHFGRGGAG